MTETMRVVVYILGVGYVLGALTLLALVLLTFLDRIGL